MKKLCCLFAAVALLLSLVLTACQPGGISESSDPSADKTCAEGVCVETNVLQPIVLNQTANITIKISSTVDKPGLMLKLVASPTNVTFGEDTVWNYDATANQSQVFHATVTFTTPGEFQIIAVVYEIGGPLVSNLEYVLINDAGATVNPTRSPLPDMRQFPAQPSRSPEQMTATAQAEPTFPPPPKMDGFTPQEWIQKCGWQVKQASKLSELSNITTQLSTPSLIEPDEQVNGTISVGFKDPANSNATIQAKIGLCTLGEGWTTSTPHEWNTELHHGIPFEAPITLSFTKSGLVPIFIVVLDTKNNRVTGYGRAFDIIPKGQKSKSFNDPNRIRLLASTDVRPDGAPLAAFTASTTPSEHLLTSELFSSSRWPVGFPLWKVYDTTANDTNTTPPQNLDRKWGVRDDIYAASPSAGGADGLVTGAYYTNNYSSEMLLGPLNTQGAVKLTIDFNMQLQTEAGYDFLELYISCGNSSAGVSGWTRLNAWSGGNLEWQSVSVPVYSYTGCSDAYLKWRFITDGSRVYKGVWVDDVYVTVTPGTVTITGNVTYTDRNGVSQPAAYLDIMIWECGSSSCSFLEEMAADANGNYQFPPLENWNIDPDDPDHRLDIYLSYETAYQKYTPNEQKVINLQDTIYRWYTKSNTRNNISNGNLPTNEALPAVPDSKAKAIWLFEDMMRAYHYYPGDPGTARVHWQSGTMCTQILGYPACDAFFAPGVALDGVFIPDASAALSPDIVVHETAHEYMSNSNGFWYPFGAGIDSFQQCVMNGHRFPESKTTACAYTEGWADFLATAINQSLPGGENCFDFDNNHCGAGSQSLESPHRTDGLPLGDTVELRVATSLWDLFDGANESGDFSNVTLPQMVQVQRETGPFNFRSYWDIWQGQTDSAYNTHNAVRTIFHNGIDYDNAPFGNDMPAAVILQGRTRDNGLDLWSGPFTDYESQPSELSYNILRVDPAASCGARLDSNRYIDFDQSTYPAYLGTCFITVRANDGIKTADYTFSGEVVPIAGTVFFPLIASSLSTSTMAAAASSGAIDQDPASSVSSGYPAPMLTDDASSQAQPETMTDNNPYPAPQP